MTDSSRAGKGGTRDTSVGDRDISLEADMKHIDQHHRVLLEQIRVLLDPAEAGRIQETLDLIVTCAANRFRTEERLHQKTDYARAGEHLEAHHRFTAVFGTLKKEYDDNGHSLTILMKLTKFLLAWLKEHIRGQDQEFADYFHQFRSPT